MPAGSSAEMLAAKERQKAAKYELQAQRASQKAQNYEKGEEGELLTAKELSELSIFDYHIFHDREVNGIKGNVDHIVIGPTGVFVLNAKNWSDAKFKNNVLYCSGREATRSVERLERERLAVEKIVKTSVKSVLVFTNGLEGKSETICAVEHTDIKSYILNQPVVFSTNEVDALSRALSQSSQSASKATSETLNELTEGRKVTENSEILRDNFEKYFTALYVKSWNRGKNRRLYVSDIKGEETGWKDCITSKIHVPEDSSAPNSTAAILKISNKSQILEIKIPEIFQGSKFSERLASAFLSKRRTIALGWVWEGQGQKRIYLYLLTSKKPPVEVGYIEVKTKIIKIVNEFSGYGFSGEDILKIMEANVR